MSLAAWLPRDRSPRTGQRTATAGPAPPPDPNGLPRRSSTTSKAVPTSMPDGSACKASAWAAGGRHARPAGEADQGCRDVSGSYDLGSDLFDYYPPIQDRVRWIIGARDLAEARRKLRDYRWRHERGTSRLRCSSATAPTIASWIRRVPTASIRRRSTPSGHDGGTRPPAPRGKSRRAAGRTTGNPSGLGHATASRRRRVLTPMCLLLLFRRQRAHLPGRLGPSVRKRLWQHHLLRLGGRRGVHGGAGHRRLGCRSVGGPSVCRAAGITAAHVWLFRVADRPDRAWHFRAPATLSAISALVSRTRAMRTVGTSLRSPPISPVQASPSSCSCRSRC